MFRDPNDWTRLVFIMNVNPMELPGGGPNFHSFDDDVRYNINIDNDGDGVAHIVYRWTFPPTTSYPDTFLYNVGDIASPANLNMVQTYTVEKIETARTTTVSRPERWRPANVGEKSDPTMSYDPYSSSVSPMTAAYTVMTRRPRSLTFAGPRQEGFYVDLERTFDLLNLGFADNQNTLLGYNVHSMALEVPMMQRHEGRTAPAACATTA